MRRLQRSVQLGLLNPADTDSVLLGTMVSLIFLGLHGGAAKRHNTALTLVCVACNKPSACVTMWEAMHPAVTHPEYTPLARPWTVQLTCPVPTRGTMRHLSALPLRCGSAPLRGDRGGSSCIMMSAACRNRVVRVGQGQSSCTFSVKWESTEQLRLTTRLDTVTKVCLRPRRD